MSDDQEQDADPSAMATDESVTHPSREWKTKFENLLFTTTTCGICLNKCDTVFNCDELYYLNNGVVKEEITLKDLLCIAFSEQVYNMLPTEKLCENCLTFIIQVYVLQCQIKNNYQEILKYVNEINLHQDIYTTNSINKDKAKTEPKFQSIFVEKRLTDIYDSKKGPFSEACIVSTQKKKVITNKCYMCKVCNDRTMLDMNDLKQHLFEKHNIATQPAKVHKCDKCPAVFSRKYRLRRHIEMHLRKSLKADTESEIKCEKCGNNFISENKLKEHMKRHDARYFNCMLCEKTYTTQNLLNKHMLIHENEEGDKSESNQVSDEKQPVLQIQLTALKPKITCEKCGEIFVSYSKFREHMKGHDSRNFNCTVCEKIYTKQILLDKHMLLHEHIKGGKCDSCGKTFDNQYLLHIHRKQHIYIRQCPRCKKDVLASEYKRHLKNHHIRPRVLKKCPDCDYTYGIADCYEAHKNRFHLKVRPFQCDICKKGFYSKLTLKEHIQIHSGLKPKQCEVCGNRFVNKKALLFHSRLHTGEKPFPCDICGQRFLSGNRMQSHKKRKHFEPTLECPLCGKMFYTNSTLNKHKMTVHEKIGKRKKMKNQNEMSEIL